MHELARTPEDFPAGHGVQVVCPAGEYVPAVQSIGAIVGSSHLFPAGHIELPPPAVAV